LSESCLHSPNEPGDSLSLTLAVPRWQYHKHCPGIIIIIDHHHHHHHNMTTTWLTLYRRAAEPVSRCQRAEPVFHCVPDKSDLLPSTACSTTDPRGVSPRRHQLMTQHHLKHGKMTQFLTQWPGFPHDSNLLVFTIMTISYVKLTTQTQGTSVRKPTAST